MKETFDSFIEHSILLADGAMGTELYNRGIFFNKCFESLNLSNPELIEAVHIDYIDAGADLIETNTFGANRFQLEPHGYADQVKDINVAAVQIAQRARGSKELYIAGSVGPLGVTIEPLGKISRADVKEAFAEQIQALCEGGIDLILLETFTHLEELKIAIEAAKAITALPIMAQFSTNYIGEGRFEGIQPAEAVIELEKTGVAVVGANCSTGPQGLLECIRQMREVSTIRLSAMPNAGLPQLTQGRFIYLATPEYMGEYARRLVQAGANIVGGCCGTTPQMIHEMAKFIKSSQPSKGRTLSRDHAHIEKQLPALPLTEKGELAKKLTSKFCISVELSPPAGLSLDKVINGAKHLKEIGVDAINIPDGPRAMARMSPMALSQIIQREVNIPTISHYCCRDRNLLGMQMDLLGAHALGLNNVLLITGDPPKMGTYPDATAVFDMDSIGLIRLVNQFNHGTDMAGSSLGGVTNFLIGCGCNPGAVNIQEEIRRYEEKITAGAEYVFSQPIFDLALLENFLTQTAHLPKIPFFVGIMPLISLKNAEFFHNEVPGMSIPDVIMKQMRSALNREEQQDVGLSIARQMLQRAKQMERITGAYIFPPLGRYDLVAKIIEVV